MKFITYDLNRSIMMHKFKIILLITLFQSQALYATSIELPYDNFKDCFIKEAEEFKNLYKLKSEGKDLEPYLTENGTLELTEQSKQLIYLVNKFSFKEVMRTSIVMNCALAYPNTSPFTKEQIQTFIKAKQQVIDKMKVSGRVDSQGNLKIEN